MSFLQFLGYFGITVAGILVLLFIYYFISYLIIRNNETVQVSMNDGKFLYDFLIIKSLGDDKYYAYNFEIGNVILKKENKEYKIIKFDN